VQSKWEWRTAKTHLPLKSGGNWKNISYVCVHGKCKAHNQIESFL